jgi:hypothetical protein
VLGLILNLAQFAALAGAAPGRDEDRDHDQRGLLCAVGRLTDTSLARTVNGTLPGW